MKYGAKGYGIYFMILERLRDDNEYKSIKDYNVIAFDLREDAAVIKDVVEGFGLFVFTEDGKYFYSESLNKRMSIKDEVTKKKSEAGKKGASKRWEGNGKAKPTQKDSSAMAEPSDKDSSAITPPRVNDGNISKESKVNKSKDTSHDSKHKNRVYESDNTNFKLANYLLEKIREHNASVYPVDSKNPPDLQKWANDIRLMHERDSRSYDDIKRIIEWCQQDDFWQDNILSTGKLRKQFGKLIAKADKPVASFNNQNNSGRKPIYDLPY